MKQFSTWLIEWRLLDHEDWPWYRLEEWTQKDLAEKRLREYWENTTLPKILEFKVSEVTNTKPVMWTGEQQVIGR